MFKTFFLVDWVVKLRECVCKFTTGDEQLETFGVARVICHSFGQRGDFNRMTHQEGWLDELVLNEFIEEQIENIAFEVTFFVLNVVLFCNSSCFFQSVDFIKVYAGIFLNSVNHGDTCERFAKVDFLAAINDFSCAQYLFGNIAQQLFSQVHDVFIVGICLIELEHGEFWIVFGVHAFVTEYTTDFVNFIKAADNQTFQVQLKSDTQIHIDIEAVVMCDKWTSSSTACDIVQNRGLNFQITFCIQEVAQLFDDHGTFYEYVTNFWVHDKVNVSLTVSQVSVGQTMEFFRQRQQGFGQQDCLSSTDRDFTVFSTENLTLYANDITNVPFFELVIDFFANNVAFDVDLNSAGRICNVKEGCFTHCTFAHDTSSNGNRLILQLIKTLSNLLCVDGAVITGLFKWVSASFF